MLNYFDEDIAQFYGAAEAKLAAMGEELLELADRQGYETLAAHCLTEKIMLLSELLEAVAFDEAGSEELISYALAEYNLADLPVSLLRDITNNIVVGGPGSGGGGFNGLIYDENVLVHIEGITETPGSVTTGTFTGNLETLLNKMLKRYQAPAFTSFSHNKPTVLEVGQSVSGTMNLSWGISNPQNVKDAPDSGFLTTSENNIIAPVGAFNLFGTTGKTVNLLAPYVKNSVGTLYFYITGTNSDGGVIPQVSTSIHWNTRIMAGNLTTPTATVSEVEDFTPIAASSRNVIGKIVGAGYKYIFVPDMLNQNGIGFKDPVNGNVDIDMEAPVAMTITNAYGVSIAGQLYRTTNSLGSDLTFNIV